MIRVLKGHPWHAPRNRRPVCSVCAQPAQIALVGSRPIVVLSLDGEVRRSVERVADFYCERHG